MRAITATTALSLALALVLAGCGIGGSDSGGGGGWDRNEITIGTSLPLTGEDAQLGVAVRRGYDAWVKVVNEQGGLLGRRVTLKVLDDASNQNTVISDFNALIGTEKVDFVIGTFSTRLALPALSITERNRLLYLDPAGAAPEVFDRRSPTYFYTEPAPPWDFGVPFARHVAAMPPDRRPATVGYVLTEDPFTASTVNGMRTILSEAGVRTVLTATYPFGERNFDPIANRVKQSGAELVVSAGGFADEVSLLRAMLKAGAAPRMLYQTNAPGELAEYAAGVGAENADGVFYPAGYTPTLASEGNAAFVKAYQELFGDRPGGLSAFAFAAGQILRAALTAVGEKGIKDQLALADWLHANKVNTVLGALSWDARGASQGTFATGQWQRGAPQIVLPRDLATTQTILDCWRCGR
ncbi:amino acid ABC transporter substrate-binding protein [Pseudonocardia acaciae]|uniref:amino acid ABC transporter substrate-binding protein n=1 Tax=Pseudonocardia acaciae TaxID=551276 RepID=UPI00068591CC|nr:amino acid ABC transporter substrate-binding protein [Pseudonocardia acaciae]